jgi:hypothetical protein
MINELGTTIAVELKENLELSLAQYQLTSWGYPYKCSSSNKTLQRFDLPILSSQTLDFEITERSSVGTEAQTLSLQGGGDDKSFSSWFQFALEIRDFIRLTLKREKSEIDPLLLPVLELSWLDFFRFTEELRNKKTPPIEPIVDISKSAWPTIESLFRNPRKVLRRERELVGLERLSEIDEGCIRWMVRQSGRNLAERAGAKQKLMGVVRKDDFDTLENRVVNELGYRIDRHSRRYLNDFKQYAGSDRYDAVAKFGGVVRQGHSTSLVRNASTIHVVPKPNFVLQFDPAYSKAWHWYIKLVRQEEQLELASKWRVRLWRDLVFLTLNNVLFESKNFETKHSFKVKFFQEHVNGQFLLNDYSPVFWDKNNDYIAQVIPAHYPGNYQTIVGNELGEIFGLTGASFALVFWKIGVKKPIYIRLIITQPRPKDSWIFANYNQDVYRQSINCLSKKIQSSVSILYPSNSESPQPIKTEEGLIDAIEIPSRNHDWQKEHFAQLGKLLAPDFL